MTYEIINTGVLPSVREWGRIDPIRQEAINKGLQYYQGNPCRRNHSGKRLTKDGQCVDCRSILRKKHNKDPRNIERARKYELKVMFGMSTQEYADMLKAQNGLCAICNQPETVLRKNGQPKALAVDHCHDTNRIRRLLCYRCNIGIGLFKNSPELLRKAALYCEAT